MNSSEPARTSDHSRRSRDRDVMTWREIKRAAEVSGIKEDDDLSGIQCEQQRGKEPIRSATRTLQRATTFSIWPSASTLTELSGMVEGMRQIYESVLASGTRKRLLAFLHRLRRKMLDRFLDSQSHSPAESRSSRHGHAAWRGLLISSAIRLLEDLRRYLDLCLARFIIWRETRRRRKQIEG